MIELEYDELSSPIGTILIACHDGVLCALDFSGYEARMLDLLRPRFGEVKPTRRHDPHGLRTRVQAYFDGDFHAVDSIQVNGGGSAFQQKVWAALRTIPLGTTASYGDIATKIGSPSAARAVGLANSQNPIAIVVPCHRVIGANGKLTGYAGGLDRKRWLLAHEGVRTACVW
jgi:methylated-DNA-[protein]-cysteine S-methyltransferase